jgi:predicted alpha/beta superfamily hydrolase
MVRQLIIVAAVLTATSWICISSFGGETTRCSVVGNLQVVPFTSSVFHNTRMLRVWLPPHYDSLENHNRRYPVLYLNDGQNLFDACTSMFSPEEWRVDETATSLIDDGKIPPLIVVGIDNAGKRDRPKEYLPFPDESLRPPTTDVHGKDYPRFLVDEVMPFIERMYRIDERPIATGIGGSSYGAGIALYTVMERPGRFEKLLLESASLYAHDDYLLKRATTFKKWPARVFIGVGSVNEPVDDVRRLRTILQRRPGVGLLFIASPGAGHNEKAWAQRFPDALEFLYGNDQAKWKYLPASQNTYNSSRWPQEETVEHLR